MKNTEKITLEVEPGTKERIAAVAKFIGCTNKQVIDAFWLFHDSPRNILSGLENYSFNPEGSPRSEFADACAKFAGDDWAKFCELANRIPFDAWQEKADA
jgi:hypothetical protein